jgi:hypothetical protein
LLDFLGTPVKYAATRKRNPMSKLSELNATFKAIDKEFKTKVNQQVKPLLEKFLVSLLNDDITEIKFDLDICGDEEVFINECMVKIAAIQKDDNKKIEFKVDESVYVDELRESATIKEINGDTLKLYFHKIDSYADVPKEHVSKLDGADEPDTDEEGFTHIDEAVHGHDNNDLCAKAEKIYDALHSINHSILRSLFNGEFTLNVSKKGMKISK